ncbi:unnamed protein product [Larinioides sclopetarius]|uniref:Uncharacterized protein n=1 Tax=Larinioides sclopetarius TaxID=280406 RepID=A0AAV2A393_9ARAC
MNTGNLPVCRNLDGNGSCKKCMKTKTLSAVILEDYSRCPQRLITTSTPTDVANGRGPWFHRVFDY